MRSIDIQQTWPRWLANAATAVLALLAIWLLVHLFWLLLAPQPAEQPLNAAGPPDANPAAARTIPPLAQYHLFGETRDTAPLTQLLNAPETPLNLVLRGIVAGTGPDQGFAIIRDASGREGVYRADSKLPGDARVHGIHTDRVVLVRHGQYETLRLPSAGEVDSSDDDLSAVYAAADPAAASPPARPLSAALPQARRLLTLNVAELAGSYGLIPVSTGGYRLSLGRNARELVDLGLQNGDIIEAANGVALDSQEAVEAVVGKILSGERLTLQVNRAGETRVLQPDLSAVIGPQ